MLPKITTKKFSIGLICFGLGLLIQSYVFFKFNWVDLVNGFVTGPTVIIFGVCILFLESISKNK